MTGLATAFAFLTRLPVRSSQVSLSRAAFWFPVVGLAVGSLAAGVRAFADQALPPTPATVLAVAAAMLATGALHEDGLADVADGVGAHVDRARRLEILRDPRIGVYGALALIVAVLLVISTVSALDTGDAARTLILAHVLARWAILPVSRFLPPARPDGAGSLLRVSTPVGLAATAVTLGAVLAIAGPRVGGAALLAGAAAALVAAVVLRRTLGGVTGDGYGATAKLAELAVCATCCALWLPNS